MGLSKAAVEIRPATWADRDGIAAVLARGFAEEELHVHMFPGKEEHVADYVRAWRFAFEERWWDYSKIWLVAVAPGGEGAGNTTQHLIKFLHQGHNWWSPNRSTRQPSASDPRPLTKPTFGSRIAPFMDSLFPHTTYWELCTLAVDSTQRHQGIGSALVDAGLARAAQESLPVGVVTAKGTEKFYRSCGFGHCVGVASEIQVEGLTNPLTERGLGGGAVLWTELPAGKDDI